jgi:hypothetical protein
MIIAGAMQGGGAAGVAAAGKGIDYTANTMLMEQAGEIQKLRDQRLSELRKGEMAYEQDLKRKPYQEAAADVDQYKAAPAYDEGTDSTRPKSPAEVRDYEKGAYKKRGLIEVAQQMDEHDRTRDLQTKLAQMTDERIREEGQLNREQQLQLHRERMAELHKQAKNQGLSVQQTDQGLVVVNASTGTSTVLKGEDGKPLKPAKDADSLAIIKSIGDLAKSMETTNPDMAKKLGDIAIGVLSGKLGQDLGPKPTEDDIKGLQQRASNPQAVAFFESKYGKGSAAKYVPQVAAGPRATAPAAPAVATASSNAPAQPRDVDPVAAAQLRREAEMRGEYDKGEQARRERASEHDREFRDNIERTRLRSEM